MKKQISVLMPFYKEDLETAKLSIQSVLNQTYEKFELILILDNPENKKVEKYLNKTKDSDKRIVLLKNKENKGLAFSRNRAVKIAKGEFIAFADGDDINREDRFEKQISFMQKDRKTDACFSNMEYANDKGAVFDKRRFDKIPIENFRKNPFKTGNIMNNPTFFGKREIFEKEIFDQKLRYTEDFDLWIRLIKDHNFAIMPDCLVKYRHDPKIKKGDTKSFLRFYKKHFINNFFNFYFHYFCLNSIATSSLRKLQN